MFTLIRPVRSDALASPFGRLFQEMIDGWQETPAHWVPALDVQETPGAYVVQVEVPGVDPEKVEIKVEDNHLDIAGEKSVERESDGEGWRRVERHYCSFHRRIELPKDVDATKIRAEAHLGVLAIQLPKREEAKARRVKIRRS